MDPLKILILLPILALCTPAESAYPDDYDPAQAFFDEAMEKRESGKLFDAIELFEIILSHRPNLGRVRLELAVAYHHASQYRAALKEFNIILNNKNTPENVRLTILAYLAQLKKDQQLPDSRHHFSYYVKAGLLHNSNINSTPGKARNELGGIVFNTLDKISSSGTDIVLAASHRYSKTAPVNIGGAETHYEWQSQVSISNNTYEKVSDFNLNVISLSTGPALYSPGRWRALANIKIDQIDLGGNRLATFTSFNPVVTFDFGHHRSMLIEASQTSHDYDDIADVGRNGDETMVGAGYTTFFSKLNSGIDAGVRFNNNDADDKEFAYDSQEIYFGGFIPALDNSSLYLNTYTRKYEYKGPDMSGLIRDETENHVAIGYNHDFRDGMLKSWAMNAEFALTKNHSNLDQFDYERALFTINWSKYIQ